MSFFTCNHLQVIFTFVLNFNPSKLMKKHFLFLVLFLLGNIWANAQKQTYVFVHGAWGGGWEYQR